MPRFFFNHTDGTLDREGMDFADLTAARMEATRYAGEIVRDRPDKVWAGDAFQVEVSDEEGTLLCAVVILGLDAPAWGGLRRPRCSAE